MFGINQPYSGHFYNAQYLEYDENNDSYKPPISFKIKGQSQIGIATGIKEQLQVQESGRTVIKDVFRVHTVHKLPYKIRDKVYLPQEDTYYVISKVSDDISNPNGLTNIMFPNADNRPKVLYLGDI